MTQRARSLLLVSLYTAAWIGLGYFNLRMLFLFAGWVGAADAFIPWSIVAILLWFATRRTFHAPALWGTFLGKLALGLWTILLAFAIWGIDERPFPIDIATISRIYLTVPFLASGLVLVAFLSGRPTTVRSL
jgi:hypothetical protein